MVLRQVHSPGLRRGVGRQRGTVIAALFCWPLRQTQRATFTALRFPVVHSEMFLWFSVVWAVLCG